MAIGIPRRRGGPGRGRLPGGGAVARRDDDLLMAQLYRQYRAPLLAFVMRLTAGDRQQAEDIVQETMLRAWRQSDQFDPAAQSLMPWLATVARRIVIDEQRRKNARPAEAGEAMLEKASVTDGTEDLLRSVLVADALRALSPAHREILNETILRDRTVNEAAEVLGIPVGTVKSRVYYAIRALRLVLTERGVSA
jgi:RNA polymerase sigma-70 factor, ECF subfamily